jgi:predicted metal-dependent hydrolase
VSGQHPHPVRDPKGHSYGGGDTEDLLPDDAFKRGIDLYHAGYLWEAHEAWEGIWKASSDPVQRDFLQGLIQLAASLLKRHVGEERGANRLAKAARERLARVAEHHSRYMGLEIATIRKGDTPRLRLKI